MGGRGFDEGGALVPVGRPPRAAPPKRPPGRALQRFGDTLTGPRACRGNVLRGEGAKPF